MAKKMKPTKNLSELELLMRCWDLLVNTPLIVDGIGEEPEYIQLIIDLEEKI